MVREAFDGLAEEEKQLLLQRGVVRRSVAVVRGAARLTITPRRRAAEATAVRSDVDLPTQLAACQAREKRARKALDATKGLIHASWPEETKVVVPDVGTVTLGRRPAGSTRTSYSCPGGEASFRSSLSEVEQRRHDRYSWPSHMAITHGRYTCPCGDLQVEQRRFRRVFARPDALLVVRDEGGGRAVGSGKSGRALTVSTGGASVGGVARLPTTAFASRA